jgi:hypothetical protein
MLNAPRERGLASWHVPCSMAPVRPLQALACAAACAAVLTGASTALAQSNIDVANVERANGLRTPTEQAYWISQSDCLDDTFVFPTVIQSAALTGVRSLEIWIAEGSVDCRSVAARENGDVRCDLLETIGTPEDEQDISITAKEIAEVGIGATGCVDTSGDSTSRPVVIWFLLIRSVGDAVAEPDSIAFSLTEVDLLGPPAPTNVESSASDSAIELSYSFINDPDVTGFRYYCDYGQLEALESAAASTSASTSGAGGGGDGGAGAIVPFGGPGTGGAADGGGGAGDGGAGDAGGGGAADAGGAGEGGATIPVIASADAAATTTTTTGGGDICSTTVLVEGQPPNPAWKPCGETETSANEGVARNLKNNRTYALAVAAVDALDNVGVLSEVVCDAPLPVTDFYEGYLDEGGQAGGGICAVALPGVGSRGWIAGTLLLGASAWVLGRRRARRGGHA